jgi:Tol biopolymer transport system component/DNA-binding winged helix-turn-helix (wHTH) protein
VADLIRFGAFELNLEAAELHTNGRSLRLPEQQFQILYVLLLAAGGVVSREEIRKRLWPNNTVVEFDRSINTAMMKLRLALGDTGDKPIYIETLVRRGYRLIVPVQREEHKAAEPPDGEVRQDSLVGQKVSHYRVLGMLRGASMGQVYKGEDLKLDPPREQTVPSPVKEHPATAAGKEPWLIVGALALTVVSAVALLRIFPAFREQSSTGGEIVPLVSMPGQQDMPAISPDGSQVAFAYSGGPHPGIYIALIGGEKPLQLTQGARDADPAWSPDGRQIAFARFGDSSNQKKLYVIPALGGSERHVYTASYPQWDQCNRMSWSPDGKSLIFAEAQDNNAKARLSILSLSDLTTRPLTSPHNQQFDCDPVFSPDSATVAFARGPMGAFLSDLYVMKVADGQLLRLTTGNSGGDAAWTQDGKEIVFDSSARGFQGLWRISSSGGAPQPIAASGDAFEPSIPRRGNHLAYRVSKQWDTVWRLDLKDERHPLAPPVRLLSGRGGIWKPSYSPDGKKIAFESNRMGYVDIWMCDSDGSNCSQLTDRHGTSSTARWSLDGRDLAFESVTQDYWQVGVLELPDGTPHMLTSFPNTNNGAANWSRDGKWIYFYSGHDGGAYQLWKIPFMGGSPVRVTTNGGVYGIESENGRLLYYAKFPGCGIWKRSLETGEESRLPINACHWYEWAVARGGIYFLNLDFPPNGRIEFFDFAHGQSTPIFVLDKPASHFGGLALSPDGKSLLFGQNELNESYIMIVKDFR